MTRTGERMLGVREYAEEMDVYLVRHDRTGRLVIESLNQGGCDGTQVDLLDLIEWLKRCHPEMLK